MSALVEVTAANFETEVVASTKPVIMDFWAEWCGPCKAFIPTLTQYAEQNAHIKVCKVNVDVAPEIAQQFNIMSIPTVIFFNQGKPMDTAVGNMTLADLVRRAKAAFGG